MKEPDIPSLHAAKDPEVVHPRPELTQTRQLVGHYTKSTRNDSYTLKNMSLTVESHVLHPIEYAPPFGETHH